MARRSVLPGDIESREDGTSIIVGAGGNPFGQGGSDQLITRIGVRAEDADYDLEADLTDEDITVGPVNVGGTREVAGGFTSQDSANFTITIEWLADDESTLFTETLDSDNQYTITSVTLKSEQVRIIVSDDSTAAENTVTGTLNFH